MMEFDGEARFKMVRAQRNAGALRREGLLPARRHPSASRHRHDPEFFFADERLREHSGSIGRNLVPRSRVNPEQSSGSLHAQRSWSAPPARPKKSTRVSVDMKLARANCAAQILTQIDVEHGENILERREIQELYSWLQEIRLQEHIPALLQMGVEAVSHLADVEEQDLEEAGLSRPERKRFLRKQTELMLTEHQNALHRPQSGMSDISDGTEDMLSTGSKRTELQLATPGEHTKENLPRNSISNGLPCAWTLLRSTSEPRGRVLASLDHALTTSVPGATWTSAAPLVNSHRSATDSSASVEEYGTPQSQAPTPQSEAAHQKQTLAGGEALPSLNMRSLGRLKEHLQSVCLLVRDADTTRRTPLARGFLAQVPGSRPLLITCSSAVATEEEAQGMTAVFSSVGEEEATELELRLDPGSFWAASSALGCAAVALAGLDPHLPARLLPIPLAGHDLEAGASALVLHGRAEEAELSLHRVTRVDAPLLSLSLSERGRCEAGSPVFRGSEAAAVCVAGGEGERASRALLLSALLPLLPSPLPPPRLFPPQEASAQGEGQRAPRAEPPPEGGASPAHLRLPAHVSSPPHRPPTAPAHPPSSQQRARRPPRPATLPSLCPPVILSSSSSSSSLSASVAAAPVAVAAGEEQQAPEVSAEQSERPATSGSSDDSGRDQAKAEEHKEGEAEAEGEAEGEAGRGRGRSGPERGIAVTLPLAPHHAAASSPTHISRVPEGEEEAGAGRELASAGAAAGRGAGAAEGEAAEGEERRGGERVRWLVDMLRACLAAEGGDEEEREEKLVAGLRGLEGECGAEGGGACGAEEGSLPAAAALVVLAALRHTLRRPLASARAEEVVGRGLGVLGAVAGWDLAAAETLRHGGLPLILLAMRSAPSTPAVQARASRALCNLMFQSPAVQRAVGAAGGVELVVAAMHALPAHPLVQAEGCSALCTLAANGPDNAHRLRTAPAVEAAVCAMAGHGKSGEVQVRGARALAALLLDLPAQHRALQAGAPAALVKALLMYTEDAGLVEEACGAVLRLAGSGELAEAIGRQGGVAAVVKGLRQHPSAPRLQATALLALLALSKSKHNQALAIRHGGVEALVAAIAAHGGEEEVAEGACAVLRLLCAIPDGLHRLARAGGVAAIVDCMALSPLHVGVQVEAASALALLALYLPPSDLLPAAPIPAQLRQLMAGSAGEGSGALGAAAERLERSLARTKHLLAGQAPDTIEAVTQGPGSKHAPRRPLSALLRPPAKPLRPCSATGGSGKPRPQRPFSATVAGSNVRPVKGLRASHGGGGVGVVGASGLELEREIVGLQAEAEGLRHANLLIMARAVQGKASSPALHPVHAHCTLTPLQVPKPRPDSLRASASASAATGGQEGRAHVRLARARRPLSGKSIRASSGGGEGKLAWGWGGAAGEVAAGAVSRDALIGGLVDSLRGGLADALK